MPSKMDRHERLMRARIDAMRTWVNDSKLREGMDWLFFELDQVFYEIEELRERVNALKPRRRKP